MIAKARLWRADTLFRFGLLRSGQAPMGRTLPLNGRRRETLLKFKQHNLRPAADTHWRAPGSGACGCEHLERAEPVQAASEAAKHTAREPREREHLAAMGVTGNLESDAGLLDDGQANGRVIQKNARLSVVEMKAFEEGFHSDDVRGVLIEHAGNLQAINRDHFIGEGPDAGPVNCVDVMGGDGEFFVVARGKVNTARRCEAAEGSEEAVKVGMCAVEEVARKEDGVGSEARSGRDDTAAESNAVDGPEMQIAEHDGATAGPGCGQIGNLNGNAANADDARVCQAVDPNESCQRVEDSREERPGGGIDG